MAKNKKSTMEKISAKVASPKDKGGDTVAFIAFAALGAAVVAVVNYFRPGVLPSRSQRLAAARRAQPQRLNYAPRPALLPAARPVESVVTSISASGFRGMG